MDSLPQASVLVSDSLHNLSKQNYEPQLLKNTAGQIGPGGPLLRA